MFVPARAEPPKLPVPAVDQSAVAQRGYFYVGGTIRRRARQGDHAGPDLCRGAGAEGRAPALSAGADPRRRADRDQLDGHTGRAQGLGGIFRRAGLHRLHDRPADARPLRLASRRRRHAHVHRASRKSFSSPPMQSREPGRRRRSTRNGRARAPTRARRAILFSTRSMRRRSRPSFQSKRRNSRNKDAGAALLDKIGPAVVLTHSQSGAYGWLIADARPRHVKASSRSSRRVRRSKPPSSAPARPAHGARPISRSPTIRRSRSRARSRSSGRPRPTDPNCSPAGCRRRRRASSSTSRTFRSW